MKIKKSTIFVFMLFHVLVIRLPYFNSSWLFQIMTLILFIWTMKIWIFNKIGLKKYNILFNIFLVALEISVVISGYLNIDRSTNNTLAMSFLYMMFLFDGWAGFQIIAFRKMIYNTVKCFLKYTYFYVLITDFLMFVVPDLVERHKGYYFIGDKFTVAYLHILMLCFYKYVHKEKKSNWFYGLLVLSIIASLKTYCVTGIVGCLIVAAAFALPEKAQQLISKPQVAIAILAVSSSVLVGASTILHNNVIDNIIKLLDKTKNMNSRMAIYSILSKVIGEEKWFGYGYLNNYHVLTKLMGAPDAQNAVLDYVVQFGIIGTSLFLIMMWMSIQRAHRQSVEKYYPIYVYILVAFAVACVEVTFSTMFILCISLLWAIGIETLNKEHLRS